MNRYLYGFNGKENDNEVKGEGNQQDYGMRIYDSRIGKFLSVDPITKQYPELTPYQFASNSPVQGADIDGLELINRNSDPNYLKIVNGFPVMAVVGEPAVKKVVRKVIETIGKRGAVELSKRMVVNPAGELVVKEIGGWALKAAGLTVALTIMPQSMGNPEGSPAFEERMREGMRKFAEAQKQAEEIQIITDDPTTLSDEYLQGVRERINKGTATVQDYAYQDEIKRREKERKVDGTKDGGSKTTFTKLTDREIEMLKRVYGNGDPKFIEKVKTGTGSGAGKVDLYKEDKTGDIYVKPKDRPDLPGTVTEYNTKDLKED